MRELTHEIQELIKTRRSIFPKSYIDKPIKKETILELLQCADQAPNHKLTQPWRFTIFMGEGLIKLANELTNQYELITPKEKFLQKKRDSMREKVLQSGAVIAICLHESGKIPKWEEKAAVAAAVQNMALAASAQHIGSYWSTPAVLHELKPFLKLLDNESCIGLFYMGYHNEEPHYGTRSPLEEKLTWVE